MIFEGSCETEDWSNDAENLAFSFYSAVLNIDNNKKNIEQQISILQWFLNDHARLKTGVMMLKM